MNWVYGLEDFDFVRLSYVFFMINSNIDEFFTFKEFNRRRIYSKILFFGDCMRCIVIVESFFLFCWFF